MGKQQTTIVINGKIYDARTGREVQRSAPVSASKNPVAMQDIRPKSGPSKHVHNTAQRSKTLMRHAVKKPAGAVPRPKASSAPVMNDIARPVQLSPKPASLFATAQDAARQARAAAVKRSKLVRRFNLDVTPQTPKQAAASHQALPIQPTAKPAAPVSGRSSSMQAMLEKGMQQAESHKQPAPKKPRRHMSKRRRWTTIGAASLSVLLLGIFITYQNVPNLAVRYASTRAGINATLPGWQPSGFAVDHHIQYTPGQITVNYDSNSDERKFTITQRESNWNSDTLREDYVATADDSIHTYEDKGRKIYLYGDSNATWISGGIWYDIKGDSELNSDQLIRIATSM